MSLQNLRKPISISLRFLLLGFLPVAIVLFAGFGWFRASIEDNVRTGLQQSLTDTQSAQAKLRLDARRQRMNLLATVAENASFKAAIALLEESASGGNRADRETAQLTLQDQLLEMASPLDADLVGFRNAAGAPVAAVARGSGEWMPGHADQLPGIERRLAWVDRRVYEFVSVPVNRGSENLGSLTVGKRFEAESFHKHAVLLENGAVAAQAGLTAAELQSAFAPCGGQERCPVTISGVPYLALAVDPELLDKGFTLWTLHSVEQASSQLLGSARTGFWAMLLGVFVAALLADVYGVRAVTRPLSNLIERLRESERSGVLQGDFPEDSSTREVNELSRALNLAARSVADSQRRLDEAYLQITQTMAQTLDARDPYTAGHSSRVSDYAVAIAKALDLSAAEVDIIRVGANLHDIGKIGIPDAVLQKPGSLSAAEFETIKRHPVIGKRILEGVAKFRDYLSIVEYHHENEDGTGYPWGLRGSNIPLGARIVHVVDAYDAMTSNRPYRQAMPPERAQEILRRNAGVQFDPAIVEVFLRLVQKGEISLGEQLASLQENLSNTQQAATTHETHV